MPKPIFQSSKKPFTCLIASLAICCNYGASAAAQSVKFNSGYKKINTKNIYGQAGTLTTPNARHFESGTIAAHIGTIDPYMHYGLGIQLNSFMHVQLRQSAEISSANEDADRLYPGADLKLRLLKETRYRPALSIGMNSAIGHKRMSGEYVVASKRLGQFDISGGLGWGRYGSAAHFENPFKIFGTHFDKSRNLIGEDANLPDDWFTGKDIGAFGSISWQSPIDGLIFSADIGADRYSAEQAILNDFDAPAPWSLGLSYNPTDWANISLGMAGTDKLLGHLNLSAPIKNWPIRASKRKAPEGLFTRSASKNNSLPPETEQDKLAHYIAKKENIYLSENAPKPHIASATIETAGRHETLPFLTGRAARYLANEHHSDISALEISAQRYGLKGPKITLLKSEMDYALKDNRGSPEEIWQTAEISKNTDKARRLSKKYKRSPGHFWRYTLASETSVTEEDSGLLTRNSLNITRRFPIKRHLISTSTLKLNLYDNLAGLKLIRQTDSKTTRGDIEEYTQNGIYFDNIALIHNTTLMNDLHYTVNAGYIEEMYFGAGAEILYRPFERNWAIGAELFDVIKRDPTTAGAMGFVDDSDTITGHLTAYYEPPDSHATFSLSAGRYLAKDYGTTLTYGQRFSQGAKFDAFITVSDKQDTDIFGGTTHLYGGLNLHFPLGGLKYLPTGSGLSLKTAPLGRNAGQRLNLPFQLHNETEQLSRRHILQNWPDVIE